MTRLTSYGDFNCPFSALASVRADRLLAELDRLGASGRDDVTARRWQAEFEAIPKRVTPSLVLPDGYVSRGLGALARLADLAAATPPR